MARLPKGFEMQLATAVAEPPEGEEWLHEIKLDGYRLACRIDGGTASFHTRRGNDWTRRFLEPAAAAAALPVKQAWIDGEVVKLGRDGRTSFQALQNSLVEDRSKDLTYFAFDLVHLDGRDLTGEPLWARREALAKIIGGARGKSDAVRYSDHIVGDGPRFFREACRKGLEGIISKRKNAPYRPGRGKDWLKIKCLRRQSSSSPASRNRPARGRGSVLCSSESTTATVDSCTPAG